MELTRRQVLAWLGTLAGAAWAGQAAGAGKAAPKAAEKAADKAADKGADKAKAAAAPKGGTRAGAKALPPDEEAWAELAEGNKRFVAGTPKERTLVPLRQELAKGQKPRVMVLTCSDSRVVPTLAFDQTLGDLFVIRTAGHVADPVTLGSLEYAAEHLGSIVLVVMGHEKCGAVAAALTGEKPHSPNLRAIVKRIAPAVKTARAKAQGDALPAAAIEENVRQSAADVLKRSAVLRQLVEAKKLTVMLAVYKLESGEVARLADA
jgi:carbonic anhydrase